MIKSLQNIDEKLIKNLFSRVEINDAKALKVEYDELDLSSNYIAYIHYVDNIEVYVYYENSSLKFNINYSNKEERIRLLKLLLLIMESWGQDKPRKTDFKKLYMDVLSKASEENLPKVVANKLIGLKEYYMKDYYNFESRMVGIFKVIDELDIYNGRILKHIKETCDSLGLYQLHSVYLKLENTNKIGYIVLKEAIKKCENTSSLKNILTKGDDIEKALACYSGYKFMKNRQMIEILKQSIDNIYMKDSLIQIYAELEMYSEICQLVTSLDNLIDLDNVFQALIKKQQYDILNEFIDKFKYYSMDFKVFKKIEPHLNEKCAKAILDNFEKKDDIVMLSYFQKYKSDETIYKMLDRISIDDFISQIDELSKFDVNLYYYTKKIFTKLNSSYYSFDDFEVYISYLNKFKYGFIAGVLIYLSIDPEHYYKYVAETYLQKVFKGLQFEQDNKIYSFFQVFSRSTDGKFKIDILRDYYDIIDKHLEYDKFNDLIEINYSISKYIFISNLGGVKVDRNLQRTLRASDFYSHFRTKEFGFVFDNLHNRYVSENKEYLLNFLEEEKRKVELEKIEYTRNEDSKALSSLIKGLDNVSEAVLQAKCHIIPVIHKENNQMILELKIGINKTYIIKSINQFVGRILNNETYKYGKDLNLIHSLYNFDEESQKLIRLLLSINLYGNDRYINLSSLFIDELFNIYKDKIVKIENTEEEYSEDCLVELAEVSPKYQITKENKIFANECDLYIYGQNNVYSVDNNLINIIKFNTNKEREIFKVISERESLDFTNIKEQFKKEVFSRIASNCVCDEEIKNEYKLEEVKIDCYFDYDDGEITHISKYFSDGNETSISQIQTLNHVSEKLTKYEDIVKSFGFYNQTVKDNEIIANFIRSDLSKLRSVCDVYVSDSLKAVKVKKLDKVRFSVQSISGIISIKALELTYTNEELEVIIKSLKKKKRFVKLNKDTIIEVDEKTAFELLSAIDDFDLDQAHLNDEKEIPLYQLMKLDNEIEYEIDIKDNIKALLEEISNFKNSEYMVCDKLKEVMRSYQIDAFKWLKMLQKHNFSGILADDMGLGKSIEVISLLESTQEDLPSLIVCPKSLVFNWHHEFNKWLDSSISTCIVGQLNERKQIISSITNKKHFYIISYDTFKNDQELFKDIKFNYCILDEAQFIKNHSTLKARSVRTINSNHKLCLTGTPIENSVLDLWSIFDFLMPGYLNNYNKFKTEYEKNITNSQTKSNRLLKKITPFILRRTKEDVLKDLPEKVETIITCEMTDEQRKLYEAQIVKTHQAIKESNKMSILSSLTRLRQICVDPKMYVDSFSGESSKLELLKETLQEYIENNHRILVFSQFTSVFESIENHLNEHKIKYFKITGDVSANKRINYCNTFNEDESYKVFLISLKAGGTGLNLTGADTVIHLDPWWNVSAQNQATDRAHRIGQTNTVNVLKLICEHSIEEKVLLLQEAKKEVIDKLISNNDENITKLSMDDFKFLIS